MTQDEGIAPLLTLLLDTSTQWDVPQEQMLALARHVTAGGQYTPLLCCPSDSPLAQRAQDAGLKHKHVSPTTNPLGLLQWWLFQRQHRSLLLHSFSPQALHLATRMARWRKPASTALVHSCFDKDTLPPFKDGQITDKAWLAAHKILCPHTVLRAALAKAGMDAARLNVVHPACDVDALPVRCEHPENAAHKAPRFIFMAVEDLHEGAGIFVLLRAMAALWQRDDLPPWEVRVTGQGPAFDALMEEARTLGVESRLALLGPQKLGDVLPLCNALLAPSRQPEGHLAALLAAWCSELPLVCSTVPGHMELARADHTALTVPPGDAQALAAAMIRLMQESKTCHHLVEHGKALRAHASYGRMGQQCQQIYADCVARQGWVLPPPRSAQLSAAAEESADKGAGEATETSAPTLDPISDPISDSISDPSGAAPTEQASAPTPPLQQTKEIHEV